MKTIWDHPVILDESVILSVVENKNVMFTTEDDVIILPHSGKEDFYSEIIKFMDKQYYRLPLRENIDKIDLTKEKFIRNFL